MKFTVIVCCVFCSTARHHTPLYVLDSWSCFLKKINKSGCKWICQTSHTFGEFVSRAEKMWDHGKNMTFRACLILYIISIIHNYKLKSHHSTKPSPR